MGEFVLLFSGLSLLIAALVWRLRSATARPAPAKSLSALPANDQDLLPEADSADGGLASFYAYQMAVSRINRA